MNNILNWKSFNEAYNKPRAGGKRRWSVKYKKKINCNNPKGFSQKQYCKRKRRGGNYKSESVSTSPIKSTLEDIFFEVTDILKDNWVVHVDEYSTFLGSNDYEVYISFGSSSPWEEDDGEEDETNYGSEVEIPTELIDCIKRACDFMDNHDFYYRIKFASEYSDDPGEDLVENITLDELEAGQFMRENESIRISFSK